ncbi:MAG: ATP phosphoribosyltransferase regulatory subunit [Betaproteobacteria bacterium SG8_40]|nr:MAG: ATP phosphoribosyltransferase regulatory subunit [Betaproteobacteria bacterium SG8_40]
MTQKWLLPEYIDDILPGEAWRIERLRRRVLDLFSVSGYELVIPPLVEYLDSLLTGSGHDLGLRTFKLVDQLSGRTLGLRADITPQASRIDAHLLNRKGITRLCYSGSVVHTLPSGILKTREPLQIGAEIYGHAGVESDVEIQLLMLRALALAGVDNVHLDLGHVAIFRSIIQWARIERESEAELFRVLQTKDVPALHALTEPLPAEARAALRSLPELYGGVEVLDVARRKLPNLPELASCLDTLDFLAEQLSDDVGELCVDLAELRGYHYHSGAVFAAYVPGQTDAIARGGRYDEIGKAFGRARPATGFSIDLRDLAGLQTDRSAGKRIMAPYRRDDAALQAAIQSLREAGNVVITDLPGHESNRKELGCESELVFRGGAWQVVASEQ